MKQCPACHASCFDDAKLCYECLYEFSDKQKEKQTAGRTAGIPALATQAVCDATSAEQSSAVRTASRITNQEYTDEACNLDIEEPVAEPFLSLPDIDSSKQNTTSSKTQAYLPEEPHERTPGVATRTMQNDNRPVVSVEDDVYCGIVETEDACVPYGKHAHSDATHKDTEYETHKDDERATKGPVLRIEIPYEMICAYMAQQSKAQSV